MTQITSSFQKKDPATERRLVLAKVYRLLIRLAEEAENEKVDPKATDTDREKKDDPS